MVTNNERRLIRWLVMQMSDPIPFKPKDDYSHLVFIKMADGEPIECVSIDEMTEDQFKKFCRDTRTKWFQRLSVTAP